MVEGIVHKFTDPGSYIWAQVPLIGCITRLVEPGLIFKNVGLRFCEHSSALWRRIHNKSNVQVPKSKLRHHLLVLGQLQHVIGGTWAHFLTVPWHFLGAGKCGWVEGAPNIWQESNLISAQVPPFKILLSYLVIWQPNDFTFIVSWHFMCDGRSTWCEGAHKISRSLDLISSQVPPLNILLWYYFI